MGGAYIVRWEGLDRGCGEVYGGGVWKGPIIMGWVCQWEGPTHMIWREAME